MYIYLYFVSNVTKPKHQAASKRPLGWSLFEEYADANVVEDARDFLHNTSLMGETIKVERRHQTWRDCVFLYLNMCNCVTKNPSMWRLLYMYYVLKTRDLKNAWRLFTGRVANARTAYYFVAGSMLPAFMGRYKWPSTIVWTPISTNKNAVLQTSTCTNVRLVFDACHYKAGPFKFDAWCKTL